MNRIQLIIQKEKALKYNDRKLTQYRSGYRKILHVCLFMHTRIEVLIYLELVQWGHVNTSYILAFNILESFYIATKHGYQVKCTTGVF